MTPEQAHVLQHAQEPYKRGGETHAFSVATPDTQHLCGHHINDACGDEVTLHLLTLNDHVRDVLWFGEGCTFCLAAASMLAQAIDGMPLGTIQWIDEDTMLRLFRADVGPARVGCITVCLNAFRNALEKLNEASSS